MEWIKWRFKKRSHCPEDEEEDVPVCSSWTEYLLIRVIILIMIPIIVFFGYLWSDQYDYDSDAYKNPTRIQKVRFHAVYGLIGFVVLPSLGCMAFRMLCLCHSTAVTVAHVVLLVLVVPCAVLTLVSIHSYQGGAPPASYYPFHSGHSVLGCFAMGLFVLELVLGLMMVVSQKMRMHCTHCHSLFGGIVLIACCLTALSGYEGRRLEYLVLKTRTYQHVFPVILNILELCIVILVVCVIALLNTKAFRGYSAMIIPDYDYW